LKKTIIAVFILLFVFSTLPANAGPGYEKLKEKREIFLKIVRWDLPKFLLKPIVGQAINMMIERESLKARFKSEAFDFILTRSEFVYSDISFKHFARSETFLFALRLSIVTRRIRNHEFKKLKGLFVQDLASKGLTRMDIKNLFEELDYLRSWNVD